MDLQISGVTLETTGMDEFRSLSNDHEKLVEEDIQGVDSTDAANLLKECRSLQEVVRRDIDELAQVEGISTQKAEEVYNYFHS